MMSAVMRNAQAKALESLKLHDTGALKTILSAPDFDINYLYPEEGCIPLFFLAAVLGDTAALQLFHTKSPNYTFEDKRGYTAAMASAKAGHIETFVWLLQHGCKVKGIEGASLSMAWD
jgi:hypothetical protein